MSPSTEDSRSEAASLVAGSTRKPGLPLLPPLEDAPDEEDGLPLDDGGPGGIEGAEPESEGGRGGTSITSFGLSSRS